MPILTHLRLLPLAAASLLALTACGGGGDSSPATTASPQDAVDDGPTIKALAVPTGCTTTRSQWPAGVHASLNNSNGCWHAGSNTFYITADVVFRSNPSDTGSTDGDKEGFYWNIPAGISRVFIDSNTKVTGHFRMTASQTIEGGSRSTSVIFGTDTTAWSRGPNKVEDPGTTCANGGQTGGDDPVHDCEKWKYSGISVVPGSPLTGSYNIKNLTVHNARAYAITAFGHKLTVDRVIIKNTRGNDYQSNSDGFGGGPGSSISNSKIDTWDDSIKLYEDNMTVQNVTIVHNRNGAPFQVGWANHAAVTAKLINVKVVQAANTDGLSFNQALFSNAAGTVAPTIKIAGLKANYTANVKLNKSGGVPMPLVYLAGASSSVTLQTATLNSYGPHLLLDAPQAAQLSGAGAAVTVNFNGVTTLGSHHEVGDKTLVTGCADCP